MPKAKKIKLENGLTIKNQFIPFHINNKMEDDVIEMHTKIGERKTYTPRYFTEEFLKVAKQDELNPNFAHLECNLDMFYKFKSVIEAVNKLTESALDEILNSYNITLSFYEQFYT